MSLVGNFTLADSDRTAAQSGAQTQDNAYISHLAHTERSSTVAPSSGSDKSDHNAGTPGSAMEPDIYDEKKQAIHRSKSHEEIEAERRDTEIHKLARKITSHSNASGTTGFDYPMDQNPFEGKAGSMLDPKSPNFNTRAWARSMVNLQARDPERYKGRTAGFAFRSLSAFGYGSATDYQKSVGNYPLEIVGKLRKLFRMDKPRRIDILRNMDGVVNHGEMLVVLGPPGRYVEIPVRLRRYA